MRKTSGNKFALLCEKAPTNETSVYFKSLVLPRIYVSRKSSIPQQIFSNRNKQLSREADKLSLDH